jgi:hypothetical protein
LNNGGNPATNIVAPGQAFFLYNGSTNISSVTLVGSVVQGTTTQTVTPGYGFYAGVPPVAADIDTNGFPAQDGMQYFTFSNASGYSAGYTYFNGVGWLDLNNGGTQVFPTPAVGQGFLIYNTGTNNVTWTNTFNVQ